ncbi:MAG: sensor histidine kinase [bacterium]
MDLRRGYASEEERERLLFRLILVNKWFLIPTSVVYEWIISTAPFRLAVYDFILPTILYTSSSLIFVILLWFLHRNYGEDVNAPRYLRSAMALGALSFLADAAYIFFLTFNSSAGNVLWLLFLPPISQILLVPRWQQWKTLVVDGPAAFVVFIVLFGLLLSYEYPAGTPRFPPADLLLSLAGLLFMWVNVRLVRVWIDALLTDVQGLGNLDSLWTEVIHRFPTEFFLVNDQGKLIIASEAARKLLSLPENGSYDWPEPTQSIRNALLLRFHAETKLDDNITVPDDDYPHPVKIYPAFFLMGNERFCIALAQEENPEIPKQAAVLRSDRLTIAGQIAAGLAHELGNPLGIIHSCASYLKQKSPEDPNREEFELIERESKRCQNLIDRLLSLASPKRDTPGVHDLRDIVRNSHALVKYQAGEREIDLSLPSEPVWIHANEGQLSAVFVNLYLNALQGMETVGPEAKLRIHMRTRGEQAIVDVTDEGVGIPKDELEKIFDPFFTRKAQGTGLGLYIVHQIIHSLGGRIDVASTVGSGTTFSIYLPLCQDIPDAEKSE